jgi:hypothetical protein
VSLGSCGYARRSSAASSLGALGRVEVVETGSLNAHAVSPLSSIKGDVLPSQLLKFGAGLLTAKMATVCQRLHVGFLGFGRYRSNVTVGSVSRRCASEQSH